MEADGINSPKFHAMHYNFVAKRLRENFPSRPRTDDTHSEHLSATSTFVEIALSFARSFKADNPNFDPWKFLDQCSPNPELFPLSELWDDN